MGKREAIAEGREAGTCPECGKALDERRVGTGAFADGVFCSLECLVAFHGDHFRERVRAASRSLN